MKRNKIFSRIIVVTLTAALLLVMGSRAITVSALADPVQAIAPVFDTEIIQLSNYIENGGLTENQLDIFFFLTGALAVAQLGAQNAKLVTPYPNEENVKEWFINCGIQLYNTLIGLVPSGDYYVGVDYPTKGIPREKLKALVSMLMGDAVVAINYPDLDTYLEEENDIYMPINPDLQLGVNAVFGLNGGVYNWQFNERGWLDVHVSWDAPTMTGANLQTYQAAASLLINPHPIYRYVNTYYPWQSALADIDLSRYDIFVNTSQNKIGFVDSFGNYDISLSNVPFMYWNPSSNTVVHSSKQFIAWAQEYNPNNYDSYKSIVLDWLNTPHHGQDSSNSSIWFTLGKININYWNYGYLFPADYFSGDVYVGSSWVSRQLLQNVDDLNLQSDQIQYYQQVANDYLFDIKGLLDGLVNQVAIPIFDYIFNIDGVRVNDPELIRITTMIYDIIDQNNPELPVNLNDIQDLTENTYLDRVKEHARNAGDIFANYVAFWHNCDSDLVYTMFGAAILVLVGAFVGKWGHS